MNKMKRSGKGSWPSPQSPKGILSFLSSDEFTCRNNDAKRKLLKPETFPEGAAGKKSRPAVKIPTVDSVAFVLKCPH